MRVRDTGEVVELGPSWNIDEENGCFVKRGGFHCTLRAGHSGPHTAHGVGDIPLTFWNDGDASPTRVASLEPAP